MSLVVFTAYIGASLAPGSSHPFLFSVAILCIAIGAGASGALNMWCDRDIDQRMARTRTRPLPAGRIEPAEALSFGIILSMGAILTLTVATNYLAGLLLALTIAFYIGVYTLWLKRRTPQNIVIGGAAGAFPPLIGWAAVSNTLSWEPMILFALIFLWTPPHFWALALHCSEDYERAGIPMLPTIKGAQVTKRQIALYSALLILASFLPYVIGMCGLFYCVAAFLLGAGLSHYVLRLWLASGVKGAMPLFRYSLIYLFLLFMALWIDPWIREGFNL
jgi:protoheme IX farnesyltransferase